LRFSVQLCIHVSSLFHAFYLSSPSHHPWLHHPNNSLLVKVEVVKLLTVSFPPASCYSLSLLGRNILFCTKTSSIYALPFGREIKFHTHTKQEVNILIFIVGDAKQRFWTILVYIF
jgi:hypothetical protein